jgi:pantoate kinase
MKLGFAEKRQGMPFHAVAQFEEIANLDEFLKNPSIEQKIKLAEKFGDSWRIMELEEDPNKPNKVVHLGNS